MERDHLQMMCLNPVKLCENVTVTYDVYGRNLLLKDTQRHYFYVTLDQNLFFLVEKCHITSMCLCF